MFGACFIDIVRKIFCERHNKMLRFIVLTLLVAESYQTYVPSTTVSAPVEFTVEADKPVAPKGLKSTLNHCMRQKDILKCMKKYVINVLDDTITDPKVWYLSDNISLKKNPSWAEGDTLVSENGRSFEDIVMQKFRSLFESRVFQYTFANTNDKKSKETDDTDEGLMVSL